jgi:hypothetical protein
MSDNLDISNYLNDVLQDWEDSRDEFSKNVYLQKYWPIPFFGNPRTAIVATVGVNPSSGEFKPERNWAAVLTKGDWKKRLKNYFTNTTPQHKWFVSWRTGLKLLGISYEGGAAAHFDISYRPTKAMQKNVTTDRREFRHMAERDVAWLFRLLPLSSKLRGLLVFGPVIRHDGSTESLAGFVRKSAPRHGFRVLPDGGLCHESKGQTPMEFFLHEVTAEGKGTVTEQVVANLTQHRDELRQKIYSVAGKGRGKDRERV